MEINIRESCKILKDTAMEHILTPIKHSLEAIGPTTKRMVQVTMK